MNNKKIWLVLSIAVVIAAVTWVFVRVFAPDRQRFQFHKPSTVFDSKTGRVYEISGDEKSVVEFDVVNGKKMRRAFRDGAKDYDSMSDAELDREFNKIYERSQQK